MPATHLWPVTHPSDRMGVRLGSLATARLQDTGFGSEELASTMPNTCSGRLYLPCGIAVRLHHLHPAGCLSYPP